MGFKYLLRGIGIGIIATAIVLGGVNAIDAKYIKTPNTSASGLTTGAATTEDSSLSKILEQNQKDAATRQTTEAAGNSTGTTESDKKKSKENVSAATKEDTQNTMNEKKTTEKSSSASKEKKEDDNTAIKTQVKISEGMNCSDVAKLLEKKGILPDADEFSEYMEHNGYDNRLRDGTYKVSSDMTYKELALLFIARNK